MTNGQFMALMTKHAHAYCKRDRDPQDSLARNRHMHDLNPDEVRALSPEQVRAVLNDFVNFLAGRQFCMDYAMNTRDFPRESLLHHLADMSG